MVFSKNEAIVLNYIQRTFPLTGRPYDAVGRALHMTESEVTEIIKDLKKRRIIRNIAAIFNPQSLGYAMGLAAMAVPENRVERAASIINSHPGVSHNYLRDHRYNIWFTLAEESEDRFDKTVDLLNHAAGADDTLVLKTERVFKIGVRLPVDGKKRPDDGNTPTFSRDLPDTVKLTREEKEGILLLQKNLPVEPLPFSTMISEHGAQMKEDRLLEIAVSLKQKGIMRRYAAVLRHMKAGFTHNAMTTWKLNRGDAPAPFIREEAVSHLYTRTVHPGKWEYPLFAMIHAASASDLSKVVRKLSSESGITDFLVLNSLKEFKKERVVYFSDQFEKWHSRFSDSSRCSIY